MALFLSSGCSPPGSVPVELALPSPGAVVSTALEVPIPTLECRPADCSMDEESLQLQTEDGMVRLVNASRNGPLESLPVVVRAGDARALDFTTTVGETHTIGWVGARVLDDQRTIVGLLDNRVESTGWELAVVTSRDAGRTWMRRSSIRKPHYMATLDRVVADARGRWSVTVVLGDCADCGVVPGAYEATSDDDGASFSRFALRPSP